MPEPKTVIAIYRVQADKEAEFMKLLEKHHPALLGVGLATATPPTVYRNVDPKGRPTYFEIFDWVNEAAPQRAHELPEVMAIWEPMGALVEERDGQPKFEFPHVDQVELSSQGA